MRKNEFPLGIIFALPSFENKQKPWWSWVVRDQMSVIRPIHKREGKQK